MTNRSKGYFFIIYIGLSVILYDANPIFAQNGDEENVASGSQTSPSLTDLPGAEDIITEVCKKLKINDLLQAKSVCWMFNQAVSRVLRSRGPEFYAIQQPDPRSKEWPRQSSLATTLGVRPQVAIFFSIRVPLTKSSFFGPNICRPLAHRLPSNIQMAQVQGNALLLDSEPIDVNQDNRVLGLFIPAFHPDEVQVRETAYAFIQGPMIFPNPIVYARSILRDRQYFSNSPPHNFGLILFQQKSGCSSATEIVDELQIIRKTSPVKFALWGSHVNFASGFDMSLPQVSYSKGTTATSISGQRVRCWSIAVDERWSESQIASRIVNFRSNVIIKNGKSIALALATIKSDSYGDPANQELLRQTKPFRDAFPGVRTMSLGVSKKHTKYCINSFEDKRETGFKIEYDENYICYMVITYL